MFGRWYLDCNRHDKITRDPSRGISTVQPPSLFLRTSSYFYIFPCRFPIALFHTSIALFTST